MMDDSFDTYCEVTFPQALASIAAMLDQIEIKHLMGICLKISYSIENRKAIYPDDTNPAKIDFLNTMISKTVQELSGMVGALSYGSYAGVFHALRSLIEILGMVEYVSDMDQQEPTRQKIWRQWSEYHDVSKYCYYLARKEELDQGKIDTKEFDENNFLREFDVQIYESRIPDWKILWSVNKISKIQYWHYGKTITDIIKDYALNRNRHAWFFYDAYCHGVHQSPASSRLTRGKKLFIQLQDKSDLKMRIFQAASFTYHIMRSIDDWVGFSFSTEIEPYVKAISTSTPQ